MKIIEIDAQLINKEGHDYIKKVFNFPDYYGKNLDALYDCLTEIGIDYEVIILNHESLSKAFLDTFTDASVENSFLKIILK